MTGEHLFGSVARVRLWPDSDQHANRLRGQLIGVKLARGFRAETREAAGPFKVARSKCVPSVV
jgi:hypothetical protein